jgi:hypothetical protein
MQLFIVRACVRDDDSCLMIKSMHGVDQPKDKKMVVEKERRS